MDIFQIISIGLISTVLSLLVKKRMPEISMLIGLMASVLILGYLLPSILYLGDLYGELTKYLGDEKIFFSIIFKIIGIAYITEFASVICSDAGENGIANKIELGGKVLILVIASPIILRLVDLILTVL